MLVESVGTLIGDGGVGISMTGDGATSTVGGDTVGGDMDGVAASGVSVVLMGTNTGASSVTAGVGAIVIITSVKLHVSGQLVMTKHSQGNGNVIDTSPS